MRHTPRSCSSGRHRRSPASPPSPSRPAEKVPSRLVCSTSPNTTPNYQPENSFKSSSEHCFAPWVLVALCPGHGKSGPVMVAGDALEGGRPFRDGTGDATQVRSPAHGGSKWPHQVPNISTLSQVPTLPPTQEATLPEGGDERIETKRGEWKGPPRGLRHLKAITAD